MPPIASLNSFLATTGRKIFKINGDGNCLFRSLSHQLLNTQEEHDFYIRTTLVRFENLNTSGFAKYLMPPVTAETIAGHIKKMLQPKSWGTHVEIKAAATYFRIPVFYTKATPTGGHGWECIEPLPVGSLRYTEIVDEPESYSQSPITHFELAYLINTHYGSIITNATGRPSNDIPKIHPKVIDMTHTVL